MSTAAHENVYREEQELRQAEAEGREQRRERFGEHNVTTPLQAGLNAVENAVGIQPDDRSALVAAKIRGLLRGYSVRWKDSPYIPQAIEQFVEAELRNPETSAQSRTFRIAGKLDVVADYGGRRVLIDHKTTSDEISDPNSPYWRQLSVESQVNHYMLLEWLNGRKFDAAVWDVTKKPTISPKKLAKKDQAAVVSLREYYSYKVPQSFIDTCQSWDGRETLEMYEARVANDCTAERPEWYFQRRSVPRLDRELHEYATELWHHSQDLISTRRHDRHVRNSGACMLYGSPCKFLGICSGHDDPESDNWRRKENVHVELPELCGRDNNVLTNSRIRCFQTCRRKHFYQYEVGLERQDEEQKESLFFGHLWHLALNAYWGALVPQEKSNGSCIGSAGSELANNADARTEAVAC